MKKIIIVIIIAVFAVVVWLVFRPTDKTPTESAAPTGPAQIQASDITVAVYDPAEEPSELSQLLHQRLQSAGFQAKIISDLVDPEAAKSDQATLLYKPEAEEKLNFVIREVIRKNVIRKGQNAAIFEDVIIASWSLDDIIWREFADEADRLNNPERESVSIIVRNAGAPAGSAATVASLLADAGYTQVTAENTDEASSLPVIIYHQRNFKNVAQQVRTDLSSSGYQGVSYRLRDEQEADIIIVLGPEIFNE